MADPIRLLSEWPNLRGRRAYSPVNPALIIRRDPLQVAVRLIACYELRVWFEPDWRNARYLAARFPHCLNLLYPHRVEHALAASHPRLASAPQQRRRMTPIAARSRPALPGRE